MGNKLSRAKIRPLSIRSLKRDYSTFNAINGDHPWREAVSEGYLDYQVRKRPDGSVLYFNFELAKEIGLISTDHEHQLNRELQEKILDAFSLQIINEYDLNRGLSVPRSQLKPKPYMATRYLQLQHQDKTGRTSGDGRSIWNGSVNFSGSVWDFSSCGTGVTCLSPGAVAAGKPLKTGGGSYSYGSGRAGLDEGISAAIASEILFREGIETERMLAIIQYPGGTSVNVRASKNLLRPSHLFCHLRQGKLEAVRSGLDYFLERELANQRLPKPTSQKARYDQMLERLAANYGRFAADLEDQYVFCWMDWDGDNMLASGGIIDYGSIRQFGIRHDDYRYDDDDRWSTNLNEQKKKACLIVQTFAQLTDFAKTGKRRPLQEFKDDPATEIFNEAFEERSERNFLRRLGFNQSMAERVRLKRAKELEALRNAYSWFEGRKAGVKFQKTGDGINRAAIYAIREILIALPKQFVETGDKLSPEKFLELIKTDFTTKSALQLNSVLRNRIADFQDNYFELFSKLVKSPAELRSLFAEAVMRASQENLADTVTGDGVLHVTDRLLRARNKLSQVEFQTVVECFIEEKSKRRRRVGSRPALSLGAQRLLDRLLQIAHQNRFSI